jgi:hypothetical protein
MNVHSLAERLDCFAAVENQTGLFPRFPRFAVVG